MVITNPPYQVFDPFCRIIYSQLSYILMVNGELPPACGRLRSKRFCMSKKQPKKIDPLEQLRIYQDRVQRLKDNELLKTGLGGGYKLTFSTMGESPTITVSQNEPRNDLLTGLLGIFRQFINNDEQINQYRVFNTLHLCLTDDYLRGELIKARANWSEIMESDGMSLVYNDKELTPLFLTDMWINDALHSEIKEPLKAAILRNMLPHERAPMRYKFFLCVTYACQIIGYVDHVITKALKEGLIDVTRYK